MDGTSVLLPVGMGIAASLIALLIFRFFPQVPGPPRKFAFSLIAVVLTLLSSSPAWANTHPDHSTQTDGGLADGWHGTWTVNAGYTSPNNGFALYHLYVGIGAHANNQLTNTFAASGPGSPAFEEVGATVGSLQHSNTVAAQFYWASCDHPGSSPAYCDLAQHPLNYFEGPMAPAPSLIAGHTYDFTIIGTIRPGQGSNYFWNASIKDDTINGLYMLGGGREFSSTAEGCCSSWGLWGAESQGAGGPNADTHLPQTDAIVTFKPAGSPSYYNWGASTAYPANRPGSGACWYAQNTTDDASSGCTDGNFRGASVFLAPFYYYRSYGY